MDLPSSNEHKFVKGVDSCSTYPPSKIMNHNRDGVVLKVYKSIIEGEPFDDILYKEASSSMDLFHHLHPISLQQFYHDGIQPIVDKNAKNLVHESQVIMKTKIVNLLYEEIQEKQRWQTLHDTRVHGHYKVWDPGNMLQLSKTINSDFENFVTDFISKRRN